MEKYAKLMKGLEVCAGPTCCKDGCPYYGKTTGSMTCRARLLLDANIAITNEQGRAEEAKEQLADAIEELDEERLTNSNLEAENDKLREEAKWACNELEKVVEARRSVEAHRDAIASDREEITRERDKLREDNKTLHADVDDLKAATNALRADRDGMRAERDAYANECKALTREVNILHERCQVQQNEINALLLKNGKQDTKTDRPSVGFEGSTAYWCGRADALKEVVACFFFGEAVGHE